jgi:hypothetical protein
MLNKLEELKGNARIHGRTSIHMFLCLLWIVIMN